MVSRFPDFLSSKIALSLVIIISLLIEGIHAEKSFLKLLWYEHLIVLIVGLFVGYLGGYAGIGGAPFMVGLLRLLLKFCQHTAQGTVLAVMLPPMSLMAVLANKDRARVLWKICIPAFTGYASFSYVGATLAFMIDDSLLSYIFGAFLVALGFRYGFDGIKKLFHRLTNAANSARIEIEMRSSVSESASSRVVPKDEGEEAAEDNATAAADSAEVEMSKEDEFGLVKATPTNKGFNPNGPTVFPGYRIPFNYYTVGAIGALVGLFGGMFGIGAGVLMVPIFTELCGLHKDDARTISLMILLPPVSIGAIIVYAKKGAVDWILATVLFVMYFISNWFGGKKGRKASIQGFKNYMGLMLACMGITLIILKRFGDTAKGC